MPADQLNTGLASFPMRPSAAASHKLAPSLDYGETTTQIGMTTSFPFSRFSVGQQPCRPAAKPRRPSSALNFVIHDEESPKAKLSPRHNQPRHSILAQPAVRPRVKFVSDDDKLATPKPATLGRRRAKASIASPIVATSPTTALNTGLSHGEGFTSLKRPARRGTVYIPPDDTTMPTIWMGVFSPLKDIAVLDSEPASEVPEDLTLLAAQMAKKRGPRRSLAGEAPRRAPLRTSLLPPQESIISEEIPGQPTGKENLPPGHELNQKKFGGTIQSARSSLMPMQPRGQAARRPRTSLYPQTTNHCNDRPETLSARSCGYNAAPALLFETIPEQRAPTVYDDRFTVRRRESSSVRLGAQKSRKSVCAKQKPPIKLLAPNLERNPIHQPYPLLSDDIQQPSLYENDWLAHQELAMTQLINQLFTAVENRPEGRLPLEIRSRLLAIYQDQSSVLLQRRLQASLLYGPLKVPKIASDISARLSDDLGMKRAFLDLWLDTYEPSALQSCAEVVIGRDCSIESGRFSSSSDRQPDGCIVSRRCLSRFLETFLVHNQDTAVEKTKSNPEFTNLHRTLLRSLMLIKLLDKAKTLPQGPIPNCLFQPSSLHKNSASVIQVLFQLLQPSSGGVIRLLNHMDYFVGHIQYPIEEYKYGIDNLAVDLRDGIRLTRLVEILLYPSVSNILSHSDDTDATRTISMPTGENLSLVDGEHDWPLSQHLKVPCLSRATKIYNNQIALSALAEINGIESVIKDIKAEDLVDGFREKTVALLWGLASKWGLGSLVDWRDLQNETLRLGGSLEEAKDEQEGSLKKYQALMKSWAAAIAVKRGLTVNNLTTSFADGKIFEAIADEYEPYLHPSTNNSLNMKGNEKPRLSQRLSAIGCSAQFSSLFSPSTKPLIFSRDFTLASLTFLASRLLSASKPVRAAMTIQRVWRARMSRVLLRRRIVVARLARECRVVVRTRERLAWAKGVIWRAWMLYRLGRVGKGRDQDGDGDGDGDGGDVWLEVGGC